MKIKNVFIHSDRESGCNNGNYPECEIVTDDGRIYKGITCACGRGCSGTDRVPEIGDEFGSEQDLFLFMRKEEA